MNAFYFLKNERSAVETEIDVFEGWLTVYPLSPNGDRVIKTKQPNFFFYGMDKFENFHELKTAHPKLTDFVKEKAFIPVPTIGFINWIIKLPKIIKNADYKETIEVPTEEIKIITERACAHICPNKKIIVKLFK